MASKSASGGCKSCFINVFIMLQLCDGALSLDINEACVLGWDHVNNSALR
jgi:hypothetical protein